MRPTAAETPAVVSRTVRLANPRGLHCRAAVRLQETVSRFQARVEVEAGGRRAPCSSIVDILALGCGPGSTVRLRAQGEEAAEALAAVAALFAGDLDGE